MKTQGNFLKKKGNIVTIKSIYLLNKRNREEQELKRKQKEQDEERKRKK